jgi:acyl transferase domain-containing protein/acyl carrier protein
VTAGEDKLRDYLRRVTVDLRRTRHRLREVEQRDNEPIAIVGIGCRYPGGVRSAEGMWPLLEQGVDAIDRFPADRGWHLESLYDPDLGRPDTSYVQEGGFLTDADEFDSEFFGISPREALAMDPQQRVLLETCWETCEHASIDPHSLRGTATGVFVGIAAGGYGVAATAGMEDLRGYRITGTTCSVASGRVAYALGLEGPAISVDTACSSSLVALHLACQALRRGECSLALAGGVAIITTPELFIDFSSQRVLAPDGRCKSFGETADGTGWGEGAGILLLERLSDARRLGHRTLAVIRGSAVNQDGASNGLTAPNGPSQQRVINRALLDAGLSANDVHAIEAHGTGTNLGDPIEARALIAAYGSHERKHPLWLGSVKSNIGHTQSAAGVAGVIKMVLALQHETLPQTLHVREPSKEIDWSSGVLSLLTQSVPWRSNGEPRRAGVSSFGIGGTNAHLIIEEPGMSSPSAPSRSVLAVDGAGDPDRELREEDESESAEVETNVVNAGPGVFLSSDPDGSAMNLTLWPVSGRGAAALRAQALKLHEHVEESPGLDPADVGLALARKPAFEDRAVILGQSREHMLSDLDSVAQGEPTSNVVYGSAEADGRDLVWVFPGQGAQWAGMALELLDGSPTFSQALVACEDAFAVHVDWSLTDVLRGAAGAPGLNRIEVVQPVLFAVMVSLAELWRACGVRPAAVVGHSQGEIAAAYIAGALSLEDAVRVVVLRSQILTALVDHGAVVSLAAPLARVEELLQRWNGRISVGGVNGPNSVAVVGQQVDLAELLAQCEAMDIRAREIPATVASHSPQVEPLRKELLAALSGIAPQSCDVSFYSTVTGGLIDTAELDPDYWYRNMREPVHFEPAVLSLLKDGVGAFVEVSPHPVLTVGIQETVDAVFANSEPADSPGGSAGRAEVAVLGSLRRDDGGPARFTTSLAEAWVHGVEVDWAAMLGGSASDDELVELPAYAFQRRRYWLDVTPGGDVASVGQASAIHPLLGAAIALADDGGWLFTGRLSLETHPWLSDHAVMGTVVLPGTAFLELALHVGLRLDCGYLRELTLETPLVLDAHGAVQLQVSVRAPDDSGLHAIEIHARAETGNYQGSGDELSMSHDGFVRHAVGSLAPGRDVEDDEEQWWVSEQTESIAGVWPPQGCEPLAAEGLYDALSDYGLEYGLAFQGVQAAWGRGVDVLAEVVLPEEESTRCGAFGIHPALLDAGLHSSGLVNKVWGVQAEGIRLPFSWSGVRLHSSGARRLRVLLSPRGQDTISLVAVDGDGQPVITIESLAARPISEEQIAGLARERNDGLFGIRWVESQLPSDPAGGRWAILGDSLPGDSLPIHDALAAAGLELSVHTNLESLAHRVAEDRLAPEIVLAQVSLSDPDDLVRAAHASVCEVLELTQRWLAEAAFADARLVIVTQATIAVNADEDVPGLADSGVTGLVRSAQSENPGTMLLLDIDGQAASLKVLLAAVKWALESEEPQIAIRDGVVYVPRLGAVGASTAAAQTAEKGPLTDEDSVLGTLQSDGTVLLTGGTGALGGLLARHLVVSHDVRNLLLVSRRGIEAPGAKELQEELTGLGTQVTIAACDVSDRAQLQALIASVPHDHPLSAVIHAAGALEDGTLERLSADQVDRVLAPKVDAAFYLHELTEQLDLQAFVLFSSVAGVFGAQGQANYAAANTFLDALAARRKAQGLPATSIAWGWWEQTGQMADHMRDLDVARMHRSGVLELSLKDGLELFDVAFRSADALVIPVRLDMARLRAHARSQMLPALFRDLVRVPPKPATRRTGGSLAGRLAALDERERRVAILELVCTQAGAVLGHSSAQEFDARRTFKELGFDSLLAVELRNRLSGATDLRLPATIVFDHPSAEALAQYLVGRITGTRPVGQARPTAARSAEQSAVAIVGMGCRYPGGVCSPLELWDLVASEGDAVSAFPTDRGWNLRQLLESGSEHPRSSHTDEGGFIQDVGYFDADFFGIGPREALAMDPQQRLLLETCWEALEDAGLDPLALRGTGTGVFAGISGLDYHAGASASTANLDGYRMTGLAGSVLSGRVAYSLGLEGPAVTVDTACSSSLVAMHLACQSLQTGECSLALVGGVTVASTPGVFVEFSRQQGLAADGRCKSFAEGADGVGLAEGVGVVVLERLSDARREGHRVLAVVRGSAINQDGASNGLTAPNGLSQQRVILQAVANAGLALHEVDAVEAHGTGTMLGDPIEAEALLATYGQQRSGGNPLWLGSIKSNIGHTQAAAGMAGVIKMTMALEHGMLPKSLHVDEPSSQVDWTAGAVSLLTEPVPWPVKDGPRRAGISSFGISGTNAHLILESPQQSGTVVRSQKNQASNEPILTGKPDGADELPRIAPTMAWVLSAKGEQSLRAQAQRLAAHMSVNPEPSPQDVGVSLALRSAFEHRAVVIGADRDTLGAGLSLLSHGETKAGVIAGGRASNRATVGLAMLFSGQGAQRLGMGRELLEALPVYGEAFEEVAGHMDGLLKRSLADVIFAEHGSSTAGSLDETAFTQPALFALEVALYRQLQSFGVRADYLIGHSVGELAAAHVSGVLSLPDACSLVVARGRLMGALPRGGAMVALQASEHEVYSLLSDLEGRVSLAAVNSPSGAVLSGEQDAVEGIAEIWRKRGRKVTRLNVSHAFHSACMDPMLEEFLELAGTLSFNEPTIPIVSNLTGEVVTLEHMGDPRYWVEHVRRTVRFADGIRWLYERGVRHFLEVGPDAVLTGMCHECMAGLELLDSRDEVKETPTDEGQAVADTSERIGSVPVVVVPALRRERPEMEVLLGALSELWVAGVAVDWNALFDGAGANRVTLPTYAFQRERYWLAAPSHEGGDMASVGLVRAEHPLLGAVIERADGNGLLLAGRLSLREHPWLGDHVVGSVALLPATAFLELALYAGATVNCRVLHELTLEAPLALTEHEDIQLQVSVGQLDEDGRRQLRIHSRVHDESGATELTEEAWVLHAVGTLLATTTTDEINQPLSNNGNRESAAMLGGLWPPEGAQPLEADDAYDLLEALGFEYGESFRGLRGVWRRGAQLLAEIELPDEQRAQAGTFTIHPALLDAALHSIALGGQRNGNAAETAAAGPAGNGTARLPFTWGDVRLRSTGVSGLRVCITEEADDRLSVLLADAEGILVGSIGSLVLRQISQEQLALVAQPERTSLFHIDWDQVVTSAVPPVIDRCVVVGVEPQAPSLIEVLSAAGIQAEVRTDLASPAASFDEGQHGPRLVLINCLEEDSALSLDDAPADTAAGTAHAAVRTTLRVLQEWLKEPRLSDSQCVVLTSGGVMVGDTDESPSVAAGAISGLVRSAQSENPGRLTLIDLDRGDRAWHALLGGVAVALTTDEPQLALRQGTVLAPRLKRLAPVALQGSPSNESLRRCVFDAEGTTLITGGTGALGALVARHLVSKHGVRSLVLTSRRGLDAEGALELQAELTELGAEVNITACDVTDRKEVEKLIAGMLKARPLRGVVHAAGVIEDGVIGSLTAESADRVLAVKLDGALYLHEFTRDEDLTAFVLFSSASGILGGPGQGNYAASNAALDSLAVSRRAQGLPAVSIAWGMWAGAAGIGVELSEGDVARIGRGGIQPFSETDGLELFDAACAVDEGVVVPVHFDHSTLRAQARAGTLPPLLRGLVRVPAGRKLDEGDRSLTRRLAQASSQERDTILTALIRAEAADVLGHRTAEKVSVAQAFQELGFDSLAALELRNRLEIATGLRLPSTTVFDYPNVETLAAHLLGALLGKQRRETVRRSAGAGSQEPIAIVGMSCRYPGGVDSPEALWEMVLAGGDAISEFPADRGWPLDELYDPDPDRRGKTYVREGGFVHDAADFDADFFGIGPREALAMDPQQRLLLEACWEAFEYADIDPLSSKGTQTGVFAGVMHHDYGARVFGAVPPDLEAYLGMGSAGSVASGRVAYALGLEGPAVTIDTACSSSLVTIHLACASLREDECSLALAGGVTVLATPGVFVEFARQRALAADARCKSFSDAADGTSWSEGIGVLLLERLSDAERLGHRILSVVRGSAVNQDGASNGLTAPNGPSQERVIRQALANARLTARDVDAIEGHGTGTRLGDPIEIHALNATYGADRPSEQPVWLGSIKSNIGHTQAAAGVAGVIKMVMAMGNGVLPATLGVDQPSRQVDWSSGAVSLLKQATPWERNGHARRAAVSSFGVSGTNAHVILEEAPPLEEQVAEISWVAPTPWVISGRGEPGLRAQAGQLSQYLKARPWMSCEDVGFSLAGRPALEHRAVALGAGQDVHETVKTFSEGRAASRMISGVAGEAGRVAFLFTGQGAQSMGMGRGLYEGFPVFKQAFEELCQQLDPLLERPLCDVMGFDVSLSPTEDGEAGNQPADGLLDQTAFTQTSLFALEVALFRLLESWGVRPDYLLGHSVGELAAAHVAGVLSLADACSLVAARGRLMAALPGGGAMTAIQASEQEVSESLAGFEQEVSLAAVNGPSSAVVSGEQAAVAKLTELWRSRGRKTRSLRVSHAFHSARMDDMLDEFADVARSMSFAEPAIPLVSNLTGRLISGELCDAEYWVQHARRTVRFADGVHLLSGLGVRTFIELGPDGVLSAMIQDCLSQPEPGSGGSDPGNEMRADAGRDFADGPDGPDREYELHGATLAVPLLRPGRSDDQTLLDALAQVWVRGTPVDWAEMLRAGGARRVALPTYAFQRRRYWLNSAPLGVGDVTSLGQSATEHPMLGAAVSLADGRGMLFTGRLSLESQPWLADHLVMGTALVPGSAFLELALHAGGQIGCDWLNELVLEAPLAMPPQGGVQLQVSLGEPDERGARTLEVYSRGESVLDEDLGSEEGWRRHARGVLTVRDSEHSAGEWSDTVVCGNWPPDDGEVVELDELYERLSESGLDYGPAFQGVQRAWRCGSEVFAELALPDGHAEQASTFCLHPALLDAALHLAGANRAVGDTQEPAMAWMPFSWSGVGVQTRGAAALRAHLAPAGEGSVSLTIADEAGRPVLLIESLVSRAVSAEQLGNAHFDGGESLFEVRWVQAQTDLDECEPPAQLAVLSTHSSGLIEALSAFETPVDVHTDTASLAASIQENGRAPEVVIAGCLPVLVSDVSVSQGDAAPDGAWLECAVPERVSETVRATLALLQDWLAHRSLAESRLVLVTEKAIASNTDEAVRPAGAALWGLVRSAQSEMPDRLLLIDVDGSPDSWMALPAAVSAGLTLDESQLAVREGRLLLPRLVRAGSATDAERATRESNGTTDVASVDQDTTRRESFDARGTVLVTGATGGLGAIVARHLVRQHAVPSLLLASRRGRDAPGAVELEAELRELGAAVSFVACDVTDRTQLDALIASVPEEHPLQGVVYAAGVLDDGVIGSLTAERVDRVLAPKVDGAWHLHELTKHLDLRAFVMFSSVAATLGGPGQGNYAAANAFLDALALHRRRQGLAGISIAWGAWADAGMTGGLERTDAARIARAGIRTMSAEEGLCLFDAACMSHAPVTVAVRLERASLRAHAKAGALPGILRSLIPTRAHRVRAVSGTSLPAELANVSAQERRTRMLELVRTQAAIVLGHDAADAVEPRRAFLELGFDSLAAVELRNRLDLATQLRLPATLIFDYPNPIAVADYLCEVLSGKQAGPGRRVAVAASTDEPIAIVGMSCRYPGDLGSPAELWDLVASGGDAISSFPTNRGWELDALYDPDPDQPGTSYTREGGFVMDAAEFDPAFFGIGSREALAMDPQQRLLLEASWEAFEDARIDPASLRGSQTGVFAGTMYHDYGNGLEPAVSAGLEGYLGTGNAASVLSGRVAYTFGLEGPAVSVDTACSSSLVALHWACQALRNGECSLALAGGVTVMWTPAAFVEFSRQRGLSRDGRCKSYSDSADGTGWSEGVGVLIVERLSDAQRLGHSVLAVVRGSAVNQDGASNGLTAPNGPSQQRVISQALADAGLSAGQVDVVEGHGTGTRLGDPIEVQALLATYGQGRAQEHPLWLGSVKSNIGHTQAAAGVAGVIKLVMALRHGLLPRTLYAADPSKEVDWSSGGVALLSEDVPWRRGEEPRRAAVSSFGFSGTNAHVILEEAPFVEQAPQSIDGSAQQDGAGVEGEVLVDGDTGESPDLERSLDPEASTDGSVRNSVTPWVLSARGVDGLGGQAAQLVGHLQGSPEPSIADVGYSLARRPTLERRAVVLGGDLDELTAGLQALRSGESTPNLVQGIAAAGALGGPASVAFLFTGQGAQRVGMGRELYREFPVYARAFDEVCAHFDAHLGHSLSEVVFGEGTVSEGGSSSASAPLDQTAFTQAGLFALEVALVRLMESYGIRPDYTIGHSIGELVAAYVSGIFDLEDACMLVAARGRLMGELPEGGAMVAVEASEDEVLASLVGLENRVALAAVNGPSSVVLSGDEDVVVELADVWGHQGRKTKRLRVSHAFHSPRMDEMLERFAEVAEQVVFHAPRIPVVSNLTGEPAPAERICSADYWVEHVRKTVRFAEGIGWLRDQGVRCLLELGPDGVLCAMTRDVLTAKAELIADQDHEPLAVSVLRGGRPEVHSLMRSLALAYVRGAGVDWDSMFTQAGAKQVELPSYAFQRRRYWLTPSAGTGDMATVGQSLGGHPFLGAAVELAGGRGALFTGRLSVQSHPWLGDHVVMGIVLLAGTAFLELALHVGKVLGVEHVDELTLQAPLVLEQRDAVQLQISVGDMDDSGRRPLVIHSRAANSTGGESWDAQQWVCHAHGTLMSAEASPPSGLLSSPVEPITGAWPPQGAEPVELVGMYERLAERGLDYGPAFQGLQAAWRRGAEVFVEVSLAEEDRTQASSFGIHPALLDAAFHAVLAEAMGQGESEQSGVSLPFSFGGVGLGLPGSASLRVRLCREGRDTVSLLVSDEAGTPVAWVESLVAREVTQSQLSQGLAAHNDGLFGVEWVTCPSESATTRHGDDWVLIGEPDGELSASLKADGILSDAYPNLQALTDALDQGANAPGVVLFDCAAQRCEEVKAPPAESLLDGSDMDGDEEADAGSLCGDRLTIATHASVSRALTVVQAWLADERLSASRLVLLTNGAVAAGADEDLPNLVDAPIWGLLRSAESENPGSFVLVDHDGARISWAALGEALAGGESQLALREGRVLVPRLGRIVRNSVPEQTVVQEVAGGRDSHIFDPQGTVLITGGTGGLGALVARHLVSKHGVRHLLLVSRRGMDAPTATALKDELVEMGAQVRIAACDVSVSEQLRELLDSIDRQHPLNGVLHTAAVMDNALIDSLTEEQIDRVLAAKVDSAWTLHELTAHMQLSAFVLFSSIAGLFGGPGQGNYAAANTFLDGLAQHRRSRGLTGTSVAWGLWSEVGAGAQMSQVDVRRVVGSSSMDMVSPRDGLELLDLALACDHGFVMAAPLNMTVLRGEAREGVIAPLFRSLARVTTRHRASAVNDSLVQRLASVSQEQRETVLLELVQSETAVVLGLASARLVEATQPFKEIGFDSLAAVELRNQLGMATGLRLPATLVFDYPTPGEVGRYLLGELAYDGTATAASVEKTLDEIERMISAVAELDVERPRVLARLKVCLSALDREDAGEDLDAATDDEMFEILDSELGAL